MKTSSLYSLWLTSLLVILLFVSCKDRTAQNVFTTTPANNEWSLEVKKPLTDSKLMYINDFKSSYIDNRKLAIWLPNGYSEQKENYQVLYLLKGEKFFDSNQQSHNLKPVLDSLSRNHLIQPSIVVAIYSHPKKANNEYMPQQPASLTQSSLAKRELKKQTGYDQLYSNDYLLFLTKELQVFVNNHLNTNSQQSTILGTDMSALLASYAFIKHPGYIKKAACINTTWDVPILGDAYINSLENTIPKPTNRHISFYQNTTNLNTFKLQDKVDHYFKSNGYTDHHYHSSSYNHTNSDSIPDSLIINSIYHILK